MPLPKDQTFSAEDYWSLPDTQRAELIDGHLYDMAPPSRLHQKLVSKLCTALSNFISSAGGACEVYPAPFAVNLDAEDKNWVEPDISMICDSKKLTERGCVGAPDFIIEIVSPSSRRMDYNTKNALYSESGVREYWIVDPEKERTTIYYYEEDAAPTIYLFADMLQGHVLAGLEIWISELLN